MPGILGAFGQGLVSGTSQVNQTLQSYLNEPPVAAVDQSPAAQPLQWSDLTSPWSQFAPKAAFRSAQSYPTLAGGVAGGLVGGEVGSLAGPVGTTVGAIGGGAVGAGLASAIQTLGPAFATELQRSPDDPEGAWSRAWTQAEISGAFSGASWAAFPVRFFQGPVKQLLFQAFAVQPGLSVAHRATENAVDGKPIGEGLGQAYGEGVVGSLVPAAGHGAVNRILSMRGGRAADVPPSEPPSNPESATRSAGASTEISGSAAPLEVEAPAATESSDLKRLRAHLDQALARLDIDGLTQKQKDSLDAYPHLEGAHKGERIDTFIKESIADDDALQHLKITPRFKFGPDVYDLKNKIWYDVTTQNRWEAHETKYKLKFGQGIPLYYGGK
jgi:hypothetical protein